MNIDTMPAGPELDRLVAEKVMGWTLATYKDAAKKRHPDMPVRSGLATIPVFMWGNGDYRFVEHFSPSTNIAHAWEVVVRMSTTTKESWTLEHGSCCESAVFTYEGGRELPWIQGDHEGVATEMPLAICRAALKAVLG